MRIRASVDSNRVGHFEGSGEPMGGGFKRSPHHGAELFRARPADDGNYVELTGDGGFSCFLHTRPLRQMSVWGHSSNSVEIIGRLGGRHCHDAKGPYVIVEHATLCRDAKGTAGSVHADETAQKRLRQDFERECRAYDSIGWWHTHAPQVGLFYSSVDQSNQQTWNHPNCIGIVLHPGLVGQGLRAYRGPDSAELILARPDTLHRLKAAMSQQPAVKPMLIRAKEKGIKPMETTTRQAAEVRQSALAAAAAALALCAFVVALLAHFPQTRTIPAAPATAESPPSPPNVNAVHLTVHVAADAFPANPSVVLAVDEQRPAQPAVSDLAIDSVEESCEEPS